MYKQEKIESEICVMPPKTSELTKTHVKYVLVICEQCGHQWGVTPNQDGEANLSKFLCKECFARDLIDGIEDQE